MILLDWGRTAGHAPGVAAIFGTGLIGGSAIGALQRNFGKIRLRSMPWDWHSDTSGQAQQIAKVARSALDGQEEAVFTTIWAAGHSGFGTGFQSMQGELAALEAVIALAKEIGAPLPSNRCCFIHTSSAGGLFEGQTVCGTDTKPMPLRPYGKCKLVQEARVRDGEALGRRHILRPSTVYGYASGARRGLLAVLIANALQGRTTTIVGALGTQRDYIFADDIGSFIADLVCDHASNPTGVHLSTALLASGRPASIYEVIGLIESCLGRPLFIEIDPYPENALHNTFQRRALPHGFRPTDLREGIAQTVRVISGERLKGKPL